jgi:hypothetical protein
VDAIRPSRAKAYFDEIKSSGKGAKFLSGLISSDTPIYESEFLEFKGAHALDVKGDDLIELWAKNLSGFANSDGGVVIFGINAPKGSAKSLSLCPDLQGLCAKLKNTLPRVTEPPVQRVEIEAYPVPDAPNTGFVACYIPPSPWRPHQVRVNGQPGQFYVRAADNCIPCNHATLRALFAPQFTSVMEIGYSTDQRLDVSLGPCGIFLNCWLENKGPATAREVFALYHRSNITGEPEYDHRLWEQTQTGRPGKAFMCVRSIHPGEKVPLISMLVGFRTKEGVTNLQRESYSCRLSISAHNQSPFEVEISVHSDDIPDKLLKPATLIEG